MKLLLSISIIFLVSCSIDLPSHQEVIDEIYNAKVADLKKQKLKDCKTKQIEKANEKVDSILHKLLNTDLLDTVSFPARPVKPPKPKHIIGTVEKFDVTPEKEN